MDVLRGRADSLDRPRVPAVATIGVFDGVHLGHREVLRRTVLGARELGARAVAVTFDRHPAETLGRTRSPTLLPLESRLEIFAQIGLDETLVLAFDRQLAQTPAQAFAERIFVEALRARRILLGYDTRFGQGRAGDARLLETLGARAGFEVEVVQPVIVDGEPVKSTRVREAIAKGDLDRAARFLGRPHSIVGEVVRGDGRGRELGFPTANQIAGGAALPPPGVYTSRARIGSLFATPHPSVTNIGKRPTVAAPEAPLGVETHLIDFTGDLYGAGLVVEILQFLRPEKRFRDMDELRSRIALDIDETRARGRSTAC